MFPWTLIASGYLPHIKVGGGTYEQGRIILSYNKNLNSSFLPRHFGSSWKRQEADEFTSSGDKRGQKDEWNLSALC